MDVLQEIRRNLAKVSTPWTLWQRYLLIQRPPPWMTRDDGLAPIYSQQNQLLKSGAVTWAVIVQANMNLFKPGPQDHPAHVRRMIKSRYGWSCELSNGNKVPVSRRRLSDVRLRLGLL